MSDLRATRADQVLRELAQSTGQALSAMIEISDRCNEVCVHCYQEQGRKGEMTTEQIKVAMDELAQLGVLMLTLSGGEATLRPDFLELVAHARKRSFAVRLFTNGLTMTRELATELHRLAIHNVEISLYSHREDVHDFMTGVPGSFQRTTAGIRYLGELGVDVHVKSPMMAVNDAEIDALRAFALSLGATSFSADPGTLMPREGGDRVTERMARSQGSFEAALSTQLAGKPTRAPGAQAREVMDTPLCGAGAALHVEPNGELRPCTMLDFKLGHVSEGIAEARAHNADRQALLALTWKDIHGCRSCDLAGVCSRCYAAALAAGGDALGPYATACGDARSHYAVAVGTPPEIEPAADGRSDVGPYRHVEGHRFRVVADEITAEDHALAARLGWTRRAGGALPDPGDRARPGELIQLRRPGSKRARPLQVPATPTNSAPVAAVSQSGTRILVEQYPR